MSLREIIAKRGAAMVGRDLGFSAVYMRSIAKGRRPASGAVLRAAVLQYGDLLDCRASILEAA